MRSSMTNNNSSILIRIVAYVYVRCANKAIVWLVSLLWFVCIPSLTECLTTASSSSSSSSSTTNNNRMDNTDNTRRSFLTVSGATATATIATATGLISSSFVPVVAVNAVTDNNTNKRNTIARRLEEDAILTLPSPSSAFAASSSSTTSADLSKAGIDNTYLPFPMLAGTWEVTQTLRSTTAPLGLQYLGGPNGDLTIAANTLKEAHAKQNQPVHFELRYVPTQWGITEDRVFNTRARLNAFANKDVVASVQYADVGSSNRKAIVAQGGTDHDPLQTTLTYFKGPAAQKIFVTSHGTTADTPTTNTETLDEHEPTTVYAYEVQRSIFALTNQSTRPPITTDSEYIWKWERVTDDRIRGTLRIADYLSPQNDKLYFETRNRAVSYQDYTLEMIRTTSRTSPTPTPTPTE